MKKDRSVLTKEPNFYYEITDPSTEMTFRIRAIYNNRRRIAK